MADITLEMGVPICWAASTYSSTNSGITRTKLLTLTELADGAARQGEKVDLGANRAGGYAAMVCFTPSGVPTAGNQVEYYWSSSYSAASGIGNDGGSTASGVDAPWSPGGGLEADIDEFKQQLNFVGILPMTADRVSQYKTINGYFTPPTRYGFPIVKNDTGVPGSGTPVDMYFALVPVIDDASTT